MDGREIADALAQLSQVEISTSGELITVRVPAIEDGVRLLPRDVQRLRRIFGPRGDAAVELVIGGEGGVRPLIITSDDVVFAPASEESVLDSPIAYKIDNAPHLVAYTEMERDARALADTCQQPAPGLNLAAVGGSMLLVRCHIAGAMRFGMRPVRAVACWESAWEALGGELPLPPFRADPGWDELRGEAVRVPLGPGAGPEPDERDLTGLAMADFEALEPAFTVGRLDAEFVATWKRWIPVTPAAVAARLLDGLPQARAEMTLYPEGGGEIELSVVADGVTIGLLQLGFSFPADDFTLDEIRITGAGKGTGLFQRLMFNSESLGALLGFRQIRALATGIGSYALAALGYPKDAELHRKTTRDR